MTAQTRYGLLTLAGFLLTLVIGLPLVGLL